LHIVFLGTSEFAAAVLEQLAASGAHRPALVVTRPDRPRGRGRKLGSPPVAECARALELPLAQPSNINDPDARALLGEVRRTVVVCAFGALIREPLLSEHELLNVHPSLLPRWRGAAPIERAIMAGDSETGVSIMRLTAGLDSGPVCLAGSELIDGDDTYGTLAPRLQQLGGRLLLETLDRKAAGDPPPFTDQDDAAATYADKIAAQDRVLAPALTAAELERCVRALHPHIGARAVLDDGSLLRVHRATITDEASKGAGLRADGGRLLLDARDRALELLVVQPPGGRAMEAAAYLRGRRV
jgi:methionyl-tRNA formyltransferase